MAPNVIRQIHGRQVYQWLPNMMVQMESLAQEMPKTRIARRQRDVSGKNHPKPPLAVERETNTNT